MPVMRPGSVGELEKKTKQKALKKCVARNEAKQLDVHGPEPTDWLHLQWKWAKIHNQTWGWLTFSFFLQGKGCINVDV